MKPEPSTLDAKPGVDDGAYLLDGVIRTVEGETSKLLREQMKIYANNRFMFAFFDDQTNMIDAATGYAHWVDGVLTETPIANQEGPVEGLSFNIALESTEAGFSQIVRGMPSASGGTYDLDEVWKTLSSGKTAFDGLWMSQKRESENTEWSNFTEMKLIGGRHYIFFQRYDYRGKNIKHFGFGVIQGDNSEMITETGMTSTLEGYSGRDHQVKINLIDADHMTQAFMIDGVEVIQSYVRI
jgi:hypothetical protein